MLTSLNVSASIAYNYILAQNNSISSITIANGTASNGEDIAIYNFSNNSLSDISLNDLFTSLGDGLYKKSVGTINVAGNTGSLTCDITIAQEKNWSVNYV